MSLKMFHFVPWKLVTRSIKWMSVVIVMTFVMLVMIANNSMENYCHYDCSVTQWLQTPSPHNHLFLDYIKDHFIDPPQEAVVEPLSRGEVENPFYREDVAWYGVYVLTMEYLRHKENGVFIEVGAGDGSFKSFTAALETLHNWNGLLIEPRKESYGNIRRRRKSAAANVCATASDYHKKDFLWTPKIEKDLPEDMKMASNAKSAMQSFVQEEDRLDGDTEEVQCLVLETLIEAYLSKHQGGRRRVDLLILDTSVGEVYILELLSIRRYFLLLTKFKDEMELELLKMHAKSLNLKQVSEESQQFHYAIFLHNSVTVVNVEANETKAS